MRFELAAAGLGVWLGLLMYSWAQYRGKFDPFEPPNWISLNVYLQVVLNVWLLQRDHLPVAPWVYNRLEESTTLAVVLFFVSLTVLWIGYAWSYTRLARRPAFYQFKVGSMRVMATFTIWLVGWVVGVLATLAGIGSYLGVATVGGFAWENYIFFVYIIANAAKAALTIHIFRKPSLAGWLWFAFAMLSDVALSLVNGRKIFALTMLWTAMYIYYAREKLPKRWLMIGVGLVFLLVPVVNVYRQILLDINSGKGVEISNRAEVLIQTIGGVAQQPINDLINATSSTFQSRQGSLLDITASVVVLHPTEIPYIGQEMASWFGNQLIPRVLWPDKPVSRSPFLYITSMYTAAEWEYSFSTIGLFADSYRAGGWAAVVIWFWLVSMLLVLLYMQGPGNHNAAGTVFYISIITQIITYDQDVSTVLIRLVQFLPLLWIVIFRVMYRNPVADDQNLTPEVE